MGLGCHAFDVRSLVVTLLGATQMFERRKLRREFHHLSTVIPVNRVPYRPGWASLAVLLQRFYVESHFGKDVTSITNSIPEELPDLPRR